MKRFAATICLTIAVLLGSVGVSPNANSQESKSDFCKAFLTHEKEMSGSLPKKIGPITQVTALAVNCDTKTIKYTKQIMVDVKQFKSGWKKRKQRQHTQLHCNKDGLASMAQWNAMDVLYDKDFNYVGTLLTGPKDCVEK